LGFAGGWPGLTATAGVTTVLVLCGTVAGVGATVVVEVTVVVDVVFGVPDAV